MLVAVLSRGLVPMGEGLGKVALMEVPSKLGSMDRISGLFHLPINEVFLGVKKPIDLLTIY